MGDEGQTDKRKQKKNLLLELCCREANKLRSIRVVSSKGVRYGFFFSTTRYGAKRFVEILKLSEIKRYEINE